MNNYRNEKGNAFIIVIWLIAILGALVGAFALIAISQYNVVESLKNVGVSTLMVESGLETWLGLVRSDVMTTADDGIIITEIMNNYPLDADDANMLDNWHFDGSYSSSSPAYWSWGNRGERTTTASEVLVGEAAFAHEPYSAYNYLSQLGKEITAQTYHLVIYAKGTGAVRPGIVHSGGTNYQSLTELDGADWTRIEYSYASPGSTSNGGAEIGLRRLAETGERLILGAVWFSDEAPPSDWPSDDMVDHNFIEIYNSGGVDTPDLVVENYAFETSNEPGVEYPLAVHPVDYKYDWADSDGLLPERQAALVLPVGIDTATLGIADKINNQEIRVYALLGDPLYTLTVNIDGNGSVTIDPDQEEYEAGTDVTLTAGDGDFIEWTGDYVGTDNPTTISMDENKLITAHFAEAEEGGLINPNFEEADGGYTSNAKGWETGTTFGDPDADRLHQDDVADVTALEGSYLLGQGHHRGLTGTYGREFWSDDVEVTAGESYTFSANSFGVGDDYRVAYRVVWKDSGGSEISTDSNFVTYGAGEWNSWSNTRTAPADAASVMLLIETRDEGDCQAVYWDKMGME